MDARQLIGARDAVVEIVLAVGMADVPAADCDLVYEAGEDVLPGPGLLSRRSSGQAGWGGVGWGCSQGRGLQRHTCVSLGGFMRGSMATWASRWGGVQLDQPRDAACGCRASPAGQQLLAATHAGSSKRGAADLYLWSQEVLRAPQAAAVLERP